MSLAKHWFGEFNKKNTVLMNFLKILIQTYPSFDNDKNFINKFY